MDNLNEEIDLVLAESLLLEQPLEDDEVLDLTDWDEFQDLLSRGEVADDWEAFKRGKDEARRKAGRERTKNFVDRARRQLALKRMKKRGQKAGTRARGSKRGGVDPAKPPEEVSAPEAVTTAEKEKVADYLDEAAELLAVQALNSGKPSQLIPKFGRILKNFFITKRVLRKGALTEELRSLDEEEASPEPSNAAKIDPSGTKDDELIKVLTKEIEVAPEQARKAFEELQGELKVKKIDDAFEEEIKKREAKGIKYLILRAAGVGIVGAAGALKEGKLAPMVLDLDVLKRRSLDEGLLGMFGAWIEYFMRGIFGGWAPNIQVKGSKSDVESFARAINGEAKYMDAVRRYGLDHPTTYKNKAKLDNSVKNFERDTGIKWPFK